MMMNKPIFKSDELPMSEFKTLGLVKSGVLLIGSEDLQALLNGRRTDMKEFHDLQLGKSTVPRIDAKLSLFRNEEGKVELRMHPIYHQPDYPLELTDVEAEQLINGETTSIYREIKKQGEPDKVYLFEYDSETNEFIRTEPDKLVIPESINDESLTAAQKEKLRKGKEVELADGTTIRFTGVDPLPFRASKYALVASLLLDGGVSFILYKGIRALTGAKQAEKEAAYGQGYRNALEDLKKAEHEVQQKSAGVVKEKENIEETRGYTRSGRSR
jgi:hypothetical protein